MAKSKARAGRGKSNGGMRGASRGMPGKAGVGKGEGLEVGNARRDAGGSAGTRPTSLHAPTGPAAAQIPGEKAVGRADQALPVEPERPAPGEREPVAPEALDQRRQVVGTDDPKDRPADTKPAGKRRR